MRHDEETPPDAVATFVLGDVEASTALWQSDPRAMALALGVLDAIVSEEVTAHYGERPVEQGEGDSFVAVFAGVQSAVGFAAAVQQRMALQAWPTSSPLRVRLGLHVGTVDVRTSHRYGGRTVNRCARLRDLANGGHVVLSAAAAALVAEDLPAPLRLDDLGAVVLRGFDQPERIFALHHPAAPEDRPVLRDPVAETGNVPAWTTSFIGREETRAGLAELLETSRLVTLVGPGGVGKTRLAAELANAVRSRYDSGVWWVDLAAVREPGILAGEMLRQLGHSHQSNDTSMGPVVTALGDRHVLLVLDNCEHLVDHVAVAVEALLRGCRGVTLLATSREPLAVAGETPHRVRALDAGALDDDPLTVLSTEAGRLFAERAAVVRPGFAVDETNAVAVQEICRRLDGLPLAIELAAAQVGALTPQEISTGLAEQFLVLTGGARTALPRQRTLEASVQWSHDLLDPVERALFRRMAAFAGTFDVDGVRAVCADETMPPERALTALRALVDKSLVVAEPSGGRTRYRLLETVLTFARRRLADSGEAETLRRRHLRYFELLAAELEPLLLSPRVEEVLVRFDEAIGDFRAAIDWASADGDHEAALRLVASLWLYWIARDLTAEGLERAGAVVAAAPGAPAEVRVKALSGALLAALNTDMRQLSALADQLDAIVVETDDPAVRCRALAWRGLVVAEVEDGDPQLLEAAVTLAREINDPAQLGRGLFWLALVLSLRGEVERPRALIAEAVDIFRATGNLPQLGWAVAFQGAIAALGESPSDAVEPLTEGLRLLLVLRQYGFAANYFCMLALLLMRQGEGAAAREVALEARGLLRRAGLSGDEVAWVLALIAGAVGDREEALHWARAATDPQSRPPISRITSHLGLAFACLVGGETSQARVHVAALRQMTELRRLFACEARDLESRLDLAEGRADHARDVAREGLRQAVEVSNTFAQLCLLETLAVSNVDSDPTVAVRLLAATTAGWQRHGVHRMPVDEPRVDNALEACRAALGASYAEAWADGADLPLPDAVAYALRGSGPQRRSTAGWDSLTPAETHVARLAADGLSNPEIAQRLFVTANTVKAHLAHVYAKLGVNNRAALAALHAREITR